MAFSRDFTPSIHKQLLNSLLEQEYHFLTFSDHLGFKKDDSEESRNHKKSVILRHDVEKYYENALVMARIQNELGIRGSYYFRILPHHFKPEVIKEIAELGHEIGYHYDDLAQCGGVHEKAILRFKKNLQTIRDIAPVKTICMDGSPLSKFDNKDLWRCGDGETEGRGDKETRRLSDGETGKAGEKALTNAGYHYSDFGIIGEPYYDMDFDDFFYLTDTGRRWDGWKVSVRDKVAQQEKWIEEGLVFHSTQDIIRAIEQRAKGEEEGRVGEQASWRAGEKGEEKGRLGDLGTGSGEQRAKRDERRELSEGREVSSERREGSLEPKAEQTSVIGHPTPVFPNKIMFTFHPQRWHSSFIPWAKELVLQNAKNVVKRFLVKR